MHSASNPSTQQEFDLAYGLETKTVEKLPHRFAKHARNCFTRKGFLAAIYQTLPCVKFLQEYNFRTTLLRDVIAGLTVCALNIPQGMAYSILAGLPPVYGLYTSLFPTIVYFLFGTSRHISVGVMSVSCMVMNVGVTRIMETIRVSDNVNSGLPSSSSQIVEVSSTSSPLFPSKATERQYTAESSIVDASQEQLRLELTLAMSLLTGLILIAAGLLRIGSVTTYLSESMLNGYTTGLSVHVATSQLYYLIGYKPSRAYSGFLKIVFIYVDLIRNFTKLNVVLLPLSMICVVSLVIVKERLQPFVSKRINFQIPVDLLMIVFGTLLGYYVDLPSQKITIVGPVPAGMPVPKIPNFGLLSLCISDSLIIAAITFAQTIALAKSLGLKFNYHISSNQELIAMGMAGAACSCFACFAGAAAVSRTMVQVNAGGQSQIAGLVNALAVLLTLSFIAPLFETLPHFVLASIILVALKSLTRQFSALPALLRSSKWDFSMWIVTFTAVLVFDADYGLIIGFAFSVFTILYRMQAPRSHILGVVKGTDEYRIIDRYRAAHEIEGVKIFRLEGPLIFASAEHFRKAILSTTRIGKCSVSNDSDTNVHMDAKASQPAEASSSPEHDVLPIERAALHHLIVDCSAMCYTDPTGVQALQHVVAECGKQKIMVLLAAANVAVCEVFERTNFFKKFPRNSLFVSVKAAVNHAIHQQAEKTKSEGETSC